MIKTNKINGENKMKTKEQNRTEAKTLRYAGIHAEHTAEGSIIIRCRNEKEKIESIKHYTGKGFNIIARCNNKNTTIN